MTKPTKELKKFTTTITGAAFDMKVKEQTECGFFTEYKNMTGFWRKRVNGLECGSVATLLSGSRVRKCTIVSVDVIQSSEMPQYAQDMLGGLPGATDAVYAIKMKFNQL